LFRRQRETLNEQLLREAGLDRLLRQQRQVALRFEPDVGGLGPDLWDAFVVTRAPGLDCDEILFWALPEGELLVAERGTANVSALADAVEKQIERPYKALAARQDDELWAVGATPVDIVRFDFEGGDSLTLTRDEEATFTTDGNPSEAAAPSELQAAGGEIGPSFFVEADRIDGDLWEVRAVAL